VLGLAGHHQQENAAIAIGVAEVLEDLGYKIPDLNVCVGLETASHPGRMEWIGRFLLDGAHNISGAQALKKYLDEFVAGPITMIFGTMEDKDVGAITSILFPTADRLVLTKPDNSRAMSPEKMLEWVQDDIDRERVSLTSDSSAAMAAASSASAENATIVVTGSLYLVGEVRDLLTQTEN
jgi:dihydrofolate synthase/folylpolyglutamate synthase